MINLNEKRKLTQERKQLIKQAINILSTLDLSKDGKIINKLIIGTDSWGSYRIRVGSFEWIAYDEGGTLFVGIVNKSQGDIIYYEKWIRTLSESGDLQKYVERYSPERFANEIAKVIQKHM